jgi:predicted ATPase
VVFVLEDLQWSDYATLDWLAYLARRRQPARLLVIGTYRPVEVILRVHPLREIKQELQLQGQCTELALRCLTEDEIMQYLAERFPVSQLPASLARVLHQSTEGNPLFLVTVVADWLRRGVLAEVAGHWILQAEIETVAREVPESLRRWSNCSWNS